MERSRIMGGTLRAAAARPLGAHLAHPVRLGDLGGFPVGGVLPRIDADTARRIVATRDGVGGFSSLEDLGMTMDLPGDVVERLRGRVVCIPR
jgi:hypothetical protein